MRSSEPSVRVKLREHNETRRERYEGEVYTLRKGQHVQERGE